MKINKLMISLKFLTVCVPMMAAHHGAMAEVSFNSEITGIVLYEDDVSQEFIKKYYKMGGCESAGTMESQTSDLAQCGDRGYTLIRLPICFSDDLNYLTAYYNCLKVWENRLYQEMLNKNYKSPCKTDGLEDENRKHYDSYDKAIKNTKVLIGKVQGASPEDDLRFVDKTDNPEFDAAYKFVNDNGERLFADNCALIKKHFEFLNVRNEYTMLLSRHTQAHCDVQLERIKKYVDGNMDGAEQPQEATAHPTNDNIYIQSNILSNMLESGVYFDDPNRFVMHIRALSLDDFANKRVITMKTLGQACLNYGTSKADCEKFIRAYVTEFNKGKK